MFFCVVLRKDYSIHIVMWSFLQKVSCATLNIKGQYCLQNYGMITFYVKNKTTEKCTKSLKIKVHPNVNSYCLFFVLCRL